MGHGDGRPGTPAPDSGGGGNEAKATFSGGIVLVGIISFVLGVIAVAVPYWGLYSPNSGKDQIEDQTSKLCSTVKHLQNII